MLTGRSVWDDGAVVQAAEIERVHMIESAGELVIEGAGPMRISCKVSPE